MGPFVFTFFATLAVVNGYRGNCDIYKGRWVYDESYPLYSPTTQCPFISKEFDCQRNGRPDQEYLKFRWQPFGCDLPRWNGQDFLRRNRGKHIMFLGDSLSSNQWQSLSCLLHTSVPRVPYTLDRVGATSTFRIPAYNFTLSFTRNAFLVDLVRDKLERILKINSIGGGQIWKEANILIFNSWHWWLHSGRKQPWDWIEEWGGKYKDTNRMVAYEKALKTWARWVESDVDTNRTRLFFQGVSPDHFDASEWGRPGESNCGGQQQAFIAYPGGQHPAQLVLERVLRTMSKPVKLLDITTMSQLRIDAHPSIYGNARHLGMDCTHWCLAGVPDTWNELLYASLLRRR